MSKFQNLEELKNEILNNDGLRIKFKIVANSKNNSIEFEEEFIKIKIKEKAIEGKANKAIIAFLAKNLKLAKSKITIVSGDKSSLKLIEFKN